VSTGRFSECATPRSTVTDVCRGQSEPQVAVVGADAGARGGWALGAEGASLFLVCVSGGVLLLGSCFTGGAFASTGRFSECASPRSTVTDVFRGQSEPQVAVVGADAGARDGRVLGVS
jgi:hypothetical protein